MNCTMRPLLSQRAAVAPRMQRKINLTSSRSVQSRVVCKVSKKTEQKQELKKAEKRAKTEAYNEMVLKSAAIPVITGLAYNRADPVAAPAFLTDIVTTLNSLDLPEALVHWGHPGNMAVVLLAMGGYGSFLGWQIRLGGNDVKLAEDLHPKVRRFELDGIVPSLIYTPPGLLLLMGGMTFFFTLGALGGVLSMAMQGQPVFSSSHFLTGISGLVLLYLNGMLSLFFEDDPNARSIHAYLGSAVMAVFVAHMLVGVKLGLSF
eukprot:636283-Prorocentrum_minimum.AAC.1